MQHFSTPPVIWENMTDQSLFESAGMTGFNDFWHIERVKPQFDLQLKRKHIGRLSKTVERQTIHVPLGGGSYFLKRTSGRAYECIRHEYRALSIIPELGLVPARVAAYCFDDAARKGFILFKDFEGFKPLREIINRTADADFLAKVGDVRAFYPQIIAIFKKFQKSGYFYRDWLDNHIFINPDTRQIGLIDLERFLPFSEVPFFYRLPVVYGYKRSKERQKLLAALRIKSFEISIDRP